MTINNLKNNFIKPDWPAPTSIQAYATLRTGGVSQAPYDSFNLAENIGDHPEHVKKNRELLREYLQLQNEPIWLKQIHGTTVVKALPENKQKEADASFTDQPNQVCIVSTADCLPILLCDPQGKHVAAIHAGWRGLLNGIIEATLEKLHLNHQNILAWLGPAIGPNQYEVGDDVRDLFLTQHKEASRAFVKSPNNRWLANLYDLATLRLSQQGVSNIYGGGFCTYSHPNNFYSYRRDKSQTGRMATLIWINKEEK